MLLDHTPTGAPSGRPNLQDLPAFRFAAVLADENDLDREFRNVTQ